MAYIFQKGISDWSNISGITYTNHTTDWIYPTKSKIVNNYDISSIIITGSTRTLEKNIGIEPIQYDKFAYTQYTLPNNYATSPFIFKINDIDDNFNIPGESNSNIGSWSNSSGITGNTNNSCYMFSENIKSTNVEKESGWLVVGGFDSSFLDNTKKIKSLQLKIVRKNITLNDSNFINDSLLNEIDYFLIYSGITTYTRDNTISLHDNYDDEDSLYIEKFENKSEPYQPEVIDITTYDISGLTYQTNMYNIPISLNSYTKPIGIWSNEKETKIYGNSTNDLWGSDSDTITNLLINGDLCIKLKINQKIFKGFGYNDFYSPKILSGITNLINDYKYTNTYDSWTKMLDTKYDYRHNKTLLEHYNSRDDISYTIASYLLSKFYTIAIKVNYDEETSGYSTIVNESVFNELINVPVKTNDIYFKYQYCFDGLCYKYTDSLTDIYKKDITTGNNINISNMYNEYNMISKYIPHIYHVDLATNVDIDLLTDHFLIDNEQIIPGQKILLYGQLSANTNDIYTVNKNYKLENSNIFLTENDSFRSKIYIKYGSNKGKQFFLKPKSSNIFPISGETKTFEEKHSYIIKHILNYDINSVTSDCKVLFTDYETARTMNSSKTSLYKQLIIDVSSYTNLNFKYRDLDFDISTEYLDVFCSLSGITINDNNAIINDVTGNTIINVDTNFYNKTNIGDYVEINFYESDIQIEQNKRMVFYTIIRNMYNDKIVLDSSLNQYNLDILMSCVSGYSYKITNLKYPETILPIDIINNFKKLPLHDLIDLVEYDNNILFNTKTNYFKHFNYSELVITKNILNSTAYTFETDNQYVNYKLEPFFNKYSKYQIDNIYNNEILYNNEYTYTEIYTGSYMITPINGYEYKLSKFKSYTYIDIISGSTSGRTLIREVTDSYMIIEKPINSIVYNLVNISKFSTISDILYEVYRNYTHEWYRKQEDSTLKRICASYANIIKKNSIIKSQSTGIVYLEDDVWNFDMFNLRVDSEYKNTFDTNMTYKPIQILDVGVDRITKLPKIIDFENIYIPSITKSDVLVGNTYKYNYMANNSFIYNGTNMSGTTYYLGRFNNGFSGSTFENDFNSVTPNDVYIDNDLMIVKLNYDKFQESKFYRINNKSGNIRTIQPKNIKYYDDKIISFGHISKSYISTYDKKSTLTLSSPNSIFNSGITSNSGSTPNIFRQYQTPFLIEMDKTTDNVSELILFDNFDYSNVFLNDVLYNNSERIICGNYYISGGSINNIDGMITNYTDNYIHISYIYNKTTGYNKQLKNVNLEKLTKDDSGSIYSLGYGISSNDIKVYKYSSDISDVIWNHGYQITGNTNDPKLTKMLYDENYNYICISYNGSITIENKTYSSTDNGTLLIKINNDGNISWVKNINTGNNISYDMTLDKNYIYIVGTYTKTMNFMEPVEIDIPTDKTYPYILKIDKNDSGVVSAKNGIQLSGDKFIIESIISIDDENVEIAGYFNGQILINDCSVTKDNTEYFITKIKKTDI